ncbi:large ribosomal subunit protein eL6 [Neocloeon triangulifer]|uniref:large ribosomal subunit protein eL6 n=1 Tax=Neocloeon triangulifer TaxID=2078957 RepID=UPI00286F85E6|nr:large ribosomal subunit protein eL6 [Neocloeon triangulifer]
MVEKGAKTVPAAKSAAGKSPEKKKRDNRPRNYTLGNGIYRFSRTRMYHKKALWKFVGKKTAKPEKVKRATHVEKPIKGDNNGGKRLVLLKKRKAYYPTTDGIKKKPAKKLFKDHVRNIRPTLQPGTVLILLAGVHRGKRVVLLKTLKTGLLLVTGPFKVNACPLRRVHQRYVIATSLRLDISKVKIPLRVNDAYFKRQRKTQPKKEEGEIFDVKKETYKASDIRKEDQAVVDKQILDIIRKNPEKKSIFGYLGSMFGLRSGQLPHKMKF